MDTEPLWYLTLNWKENELEKKLWSYVICNRMLVYQCVRACGCYNPFIRRTRARTHTQFKEQTMKLKCKPDTKTTASFINNTYYCVHVCVRAGVCFYSLGTPSNQLSWRVTTLEHDTSGRTHTRQGHVQSLIKSLAALSRSDCGECVMATAWKGGCQHSSLEDGARLSLRAMSMPDKARTQHLSTLHAAPRRSTAVKKLLQSTENGPQRLFYLLKTGGLKSHRSNWWLWLH